MKQSQTQLLFAGLLVVFAIATRIIFNVLHVYNFSAVMAAGLFAGAYLGSRRIGFVIPLLVMLATDAILGFYDWQLMFFVYASLASAVFIGKYYSKNRTLPRFVGSVLGGSALFFLVTNGAVWLLATETIYPRSLAGLAQCYATGLPFYRGTLAGDLLWSAVLFGSYELLKFKAPKRVAVTQ